MKPRSIGPAGMSGRVTSIAADPRNSNIIYIGTASGGLWKSANGGITWDPLFDDQPVASIGAVAVDPLNPDVIWAGTGEGNPRNSQTVGYGIFKSVDAGRTWKHLGLEKTEHIHRVLIHPDNPDIVYAAALGATWGENPERGVFKTADGGRSWEKVLYVDEKSGAADLVMDPRNPDKLVAAMWGHRRWPWFFKSGGPGSGLYVTFNGGIDWERRGEENGLPRGELGRIGLAIAHNRPNVLYALVESEKNALYRSDDGGYQWKKVNDGRNVVNRPFYYADIFVDPSNENRIYNLASGITYSEDGGKTFESVFRGRTIHPDHHAFWVDPEDPDYLIEGNDGGMAISRDRGKTWRFIENLPLGQFYHVNIDDRRPYRIYGGLQDNGSWMGPAYVWGQGGMRNAYWRDVGFGDGFDVAPDPGDPDWVYSMSQGGNLRRYNLVTGTSKTIRPPDPEGRRLRFHWNAALALDPFDDRALYYGSQFVHRSPNRGDEWEIISPDLTTNDPEKQKQLDSGGLTYDVTGAENHTTILTIAPSPIERGVIWAGTDDGNVQVTRDGGRNWTNVIDNIPGVPAHTWVPHIEASRFDAGEAFVVFDDHRRSNWTPYVFHTGDFGSTWTSLSMGDLWGYCHVIEQDSEVESLLFLGTEFHLYFSLDKGRSWTKWDQGFPTVAVRDLAVHPREGDLVIGTFGRALYVMDDLRPLREMARKGTDLLDRPVHLFDAPVLVQADFSGPPGVLFPGHAEFVGDNRPRGVTISYVINKPEGSDDESDGSDDSSGRRGPPPGADRPGGRAESRDKNRVKVEILEGDEVIRTLEGSSEPGLNRTTWGGRRKGIRLPGRGFGGGQPRGEPAGLRVIPGEYTVRVSWGEHEASGTVTVIKDPRSSLSLDDIRAKDEFVRRYMSYVEAAADAVRRLGEARETLTQVGELIGKGEPGNGSELRRAGRELRETLGKLSQQVQPEPVQGIRRDPELLISQIFRTQDYMTSTWERPSANERYVFEQTRKRIDTFLEEVNDFFANDWEDYRKAVEEANLTPVKKYEKIEIN